MIDCAALFVKRKSEYKNIPGVDCYDIDRDARNYRGDYPVIAHPPCAQWGRLYKFANVNPVDKLLGVWAVNKVRKLGGVLEQPAYSKLFKYCGLPTPKESIDSSGGYTIDIDQSWFGFKATKRTWLYIVGLPKSELPQLPMNLDCTSYVICTSKAKKLYIKKEMRKSERDITTVQLANYLVNIARQCKV